MRSEVLVNSRIAVIESMLGSRIEPFVIKILHGIKPPSGKLFRIVRSETGFRVLPSQVPETARSENRCANERLYQQLDELAGQIRLQMNDMPRMSLNERLQLLLQRVSRRLMFSSVSLSSLDLMLRLLGLVQESLADSHCDIKGPRLHRLTLYSLLLNEPDHTVRKLLRWHDFYKKSFYARRLRYLREESVTHTSLESFEWHEREAYLDCALRHTESRVLITIHMGDFFGAFRHIAMQGQQDRPVISLRRDANQLNPRHLRGRNDGAHKLYMHGEDSPAAIVSALRKGNQTLAILFDLGRDFGQIAEVDFFGHRAGFVRGPAQMAIAGHARIFPFVCFRSGSRTVIQMHPPFLPQARTDESLDQAAARVTQQLVTLAEKWIRAHPAQWKYLDVLPAYFLPVACNTAGSDSARASAP